jgi:serine/threonine protein kinase
LCTKAHRKPTGIMESKRFDDDIWLLDRITQGSEYDLHLAFWPAENQRILVKSLRPTSDSIRRKKVESRLLKEAATLEEFWSPYFPKVYDIRRNSEGTLYLILQYFEGVSLRQYLDLNIDNGIKFKVAQKIDSELTHALKYLHTKKNVIHFDLSPENIIISPENKVHLIDFEDAKIIGQKIAQKNIRGKAKYMAPELKSSIGQISASTSYDEYAKSIIYKEMLSLCSTLDRLKGGQLFLPSISAPKFSTKHSSIFKRTSLALTLTLFVLLGLTFGPFYKQESPSKKQSARSTNSNIQKKKVKSLKRKRLSRSPALPKAQIVKRRSAAIEKKSTRKVAPKTSFKQHFQRIVSTQDKKLQACLKPLKRKEITLGFVLQEKTGKLLKLRSKKNIRIDENISSCISKLYKDLKYPIHPSKKEVEITQRFIIVNKS